MRCPNCDGEDFSGFGNRPFNPDDGLLCMKCGWQKKPYTPFPERKIWHPRDVEYFEEYCAPVMENIHRLHFTNVNSTIPFFGPMLYFLARQLGAERILEIGVAEAYTSFYLAHAVNDNAKRFKMAGNEYIGVDIVQTEKSTHNLLKWGLPITVHNMDSKNLTTGFFGDKPFDIIFQDGNHTTDYVIYEFEQMWPDVKGGGDGFFICHDCYGPSEEGCREILKKIELDKIPVEFLRIPGMYGLLLIRKMEGYDYEKRYWRD